MELSFNEKQFGKLNDIGRPGDKNFIVCNTDISVKLNRIKLNTSKVILSHEKNKCGFEIILWFKKYHKWAQVC